MLRLCLTLLAQLGPTGLFFGSLIYLISLPAAATPSTNQVVQTGPNTFQIGSIDLNRSQRTLTFPAEVRITHEVVEYALVTTDGKTHESILTTEVSPTQLHTAVLLLGVEPETDLGVTNSVVAARAKSRIRIEVEWTAGGRSRRLPLERWILLRPEHGKQASRRLRLSGWSYTGSFLHEGRFVAQEEGSIISLIRDPVALINNPGVDRDDDDCHFVDPSLIPPKGTRVRMRLRF